MTVLVNGLERSGPVERQGDPKDGRVVALVALSAKGKAFMRLRRREGEVELEQLMEKLAPEELAALTAAIPALEHLSELDQRHQDQLDPRLPT
jgi:DNA-binding MarR family transcriptional regulator